MRKRTGGRGERRRVGILERLGVVHTPSPSSIAIGTLHPSPPRRSASRSRRVGFADIPQRQIELPAAFFRAACVETPCRRRWPAVESGHLRELWKAPPSFHSGAAFLAHSTIAVRGQGPGSQRAGIEPVLGGAKSTVAQPVGSDSDSITERRPSGRRTAERVTANRHASPRE